MTYEQLARCHIYNDRADILILSFAVLYLATVLTSVLFTINPLTFLPISLLFIFICLYALRLNKHNQRNKYSYNLANEIFKNSGALEPFLPKEYDLFHLLNSKLSIDTFLLIQSQMGVLYDWFEKGYSPFKIRSKNNKSLSDWCYIAAMKATLGKSIKRVNHLQLSIFFEDKIDNRKISRFNTTADYASDKVLDYAKQFHIAAKKLGIEL